MRKMSNKGFDLIGDIHGYAIPLRRLLKKLGYREVHGVFRHDIRTVIFLGDFIDRGPEQREVLSIARGMCEAGSACAVLGNHEFNAIAWAALDARGNPLREHSEKNRRQYEEFLRQLNEGSSEYDAAIQWFKTLPVWLEFPDLRVVHAYWHKDSREDLRSSLDTNNCFTEKGLREASTRGSRPCAAAEILLKGPEQALPPGVFLRDKDGHDRREVRTRWWDPNATTFRKAAIGMDDMLDQLPDEQLPVDFRYSDSIPVVFGHYWMSGEPGITASNAACLDFSVAKQGHLTAYRWSGEAELLSRNLVYVRADSADA